MQIFAKTLLLTFCLIQAVYADREITLAMVTLDQATKKVIEKDGNKVMGAKTEIMEGKKVHIIKVLTSDGRVQYIKVDAESGKLLK
ncbi:MAG: hypothetical protein QM500_05420 [Methylococcales bacterium]